MASTKKKVKLKPVGGPFLAAAIFCDSIVQGMDGALSAIRIVDKINVTIPAEAPPNVPSEEIRVPVTTWLLLMFKSGSAKGKHKVELVVHSPSGKKQDGLKQEVTLSPNPSGGANLRIQFAIGVKEGGLFMIDVVLDGEVVTRMPLLISLTREEAKPPAEKPAKSKRKGS
jgi:hypothetical protein